MPLQLWIQGRGHFFVDFFLDCPVQVGQVYREQEDGPWTVDVNDEYIAAPDLETAKRVFVEKYDRSQVQLSPGSLEPWDGSTEGFTVVELSPP